MVAVLVVPAGLYFHRFWTLEDPAQRQMQSGNLSSIRSGAVAPDGATLYVTGTSFGTKAACALIAC